MQTNDKTGYSKRVLIELAGVFIVVIVLSFLFPAVKGMFGLIPLAYLLAERIIRKRTFSEIGLKPKNMLSDIRRNWLWIVLVVIVSPVVVLLFAQYFVPDFLSHLLTRVPLLKLDQLLPLLASILVGTFLEELVYRSLLQGRLSHFMRPAGAIVLSSAIFALMHFAAGPAIVVGYDLLTILLDSVIYGIIYHRTQNVYVSWLAHLLADIFAVAAILVMF